VSGIVADGIQIEVPGWPSTSWLDEPALRLKLPEDGAARRTRPRSIGLHTTRGTMPQPLISEPAADKDCTARATVRAWRIEKRQAGAHLLVDADGEILCVADVVREMSYHTPRLNTVSIGIEVVQRRKDGALFEPQLRATVALVRLLCGLFLIEQRVIWPMPRAPLPAVQMQQYSGVFGHRDVDANRGKGDPGELLPQALLQAGFRADDGQLFVGFG